jgi:hypothetical protein
MRLPATRLVARRGGLLAALFFALVSLPAQGVGFATSLVANGSFEGSLAGWAASHATLSLATDGAVGANAARVALSGTATTFSLYSWPRPTVPPPAGIAYTGGGSVRTDTAGARICLAVRELDASGAQVGLATSCLTSTTAWQAFQPVVYVTVSAGDSLVFSVTESRATAGASFEADGLSLTSTPPETTITAGPPTDSSSTTASFSFSSNQPDATFACSLDNAPFSPCVSPQGYSGLADGPHAFAVKATDAAGTVDPTPATSSWTVDTSHELLANGSFEGSLAGWVASSATVALAHDGIAGGDAARLALTGSATSYALRTRPSPVVSTYAHVSYTAGGSVRSDVAGRKVCLILREYSPAGVAVGSAASCLVAAGSWRPFPPLTYLTAAAGDSLALTLSQAGATAGDSFEVDGLTLAEADPVIAAAGDIACAPDDPAYGGGAGSGANCQQLATSNLLVGTGLAAVLPLGDNQYECGGPTAYAQSYAGSWGRVKGITHPVPGNHEYYVNSTASPCDSTVSAAGYFGYFGSAAGDPTKGYYSYDLGTWHLIALNAQCTQVGGCSAGSPQEQWLKADLAAHPDQCVLAYWHQPRFSSGSHGDAPVYLPFWRDLYAVGADVILNGHDHNYERFAPLDPSGNLDTAHGIREFVVGTGGRNHSAFQSLHTNSLVRNADAFGVLEVTLRPTGYDWRFVPVAGSSGFTDSGSDTCHHAQTDTTPPSTPANLAASATGANTVALSWSAATDNVGVTGYDIRRNGVQVATAPGTGYVDAGLTSGTTYTYSVVARDAAGNASAASSPASATTAADTTNVVFGDGFESGDLSRWTFSTGIVVQQQVVAAGAWAARGTTTSAATYAYDQLATPQTELSYALRFEIVSHGASTVNLLKIRPATGGSIAGIYLKSTNMLTFQNDVLPLALSSGTVVSQGVWHDLKVHLVVGGATGSLSEVWLDGVKLAALTHTDSLGSAPVGRVELGDRALGHTYDVAFDDVRVTHP